MVRLHFQLFKGVQYVHVELCCSAPRESQGLYRNTSGTMNYRSAEMSLDARQSVLIREKNALSFSLIYIPA